MALRRIGKPTVAGTQRADLSRERRFVEERSAKNLESKEIPRAQLHAAKPLERIFARQGEKGIVRAYKEHGYRAHLGVHYATVSQRLKQLEQAK
jgi:hypothetical protein